MSDLITQVKLIASYLPEGLAFGTKLQTDSTLYKLLQGLGQELLRSSDLVQEFRDNILPNETVLLLSEWEGAVGIPDQCFTTTSGTTAERQRNVTVKLASLGVQTAQDMEDLAALMGINATIEAGGPHGTGLPYTLPIVFFPDDKAARHTILVFLQEPAPIGFPYTFPIVFGSQELAIVQCLLNRVKPANVDLQFIDLS